MFKTKSKSKRVPLESLQIPRQFSRVQHSRSVPGLEFTGVEEAERRGESTHGSRCRGPRGPPGSSGESGVGEERSGDTPLPFNTFQVRSAPFGRGQGRRVGPVHPRLPQSCCRTLLAGFLCLCHVPRRRGGPGLAPQPLPFAL